jgi:hypothetical protein
MYLTFQITDALVDIGSVGCVLVWASQCLAFIRYHQWQVPRIHLEIIKP